jgi:tRNA pseudouridine13 synthase
LLARYTDFLVNEIELGGQVLHLTSTAVPVKITDKKSTEQHPATDVAKPAEADNGTAKQEETEVVKVEKSEPTAASESNGKPKDEEPGKVCARWMNYPISSDLKQISEEAQAELEDLFGAPCVDALVRFYREVLQKPDKKPKDMRTISTWSIDDKSRRGKAHEAIRRIFKNALASSHAEKNQIIIGKAAKGGRGADGSKWSRNDAGNDRGKGKLGWEELGGEYLHFTLHKENRDTMEVVNFIGSRLKCAPKNFQFAGTKDRRAVTVQRVSVFRQHAWQLAGLNKILKHGSKIGEFKYETYGLELGALWGNEFVITLRDCHFAGEEGKWTFDDQLDLARKTVGDAVSRLQENGFLNYYGLQRFGSFAAGTDDIGRKLLQGDFESAVNMILEFHPSALEAAKDENTTAKISSDDCNRALALDTWRRTGNAHQAVEQMPRKFSSESNIIRYLGAERGGRKIRENDYQGAMQAIQRNMRLMYVHAYQSLVWNTVAGKRWEFHGSKVIEGDLVIIGDKQDGAKDEPEVDEDGEPIIRPTAEDSAAADGDFTRARPLSKQEAESGKYDIFDVVLPLPGWDVVYPKNELGQFYKDFMGSDQGGNLDPYDMRRKWKDYSLSGGYRKLLSRPAPGMSFEVKGYREETAQLVETDLERLAKEEGKPNSRSNGAATDEDAEMKSEGDKYIAVILKLQLGASQYATMALRELLKAGGLKSYKADFSGRGY